MGAWMEILTYVLELARKKNLVLEEGGESEDSPSFLILTMFEFSVSVIVSRYLDYLRDT